MFYLFSHFTASWELLIRLACDGHEVKFDFVSLSTLAIMKQFSLFPPTKRNLRLLNGWKIYALNIIAKLTIKTRTLKRHFLD